MKYQLTNTTQVFYGHILHQIVAIKSFGNIRPGDLGGWVESLDNLSQDGDCWIYEDAKVYDRACVLGDAIVKGTAVLKDYARVSDHAYISGCVFLHGSAVVNGYSRVTGGAVVKDYACICDNAIISGQAVIHGDVMIDGCTKVWGEATIGGNIHINANITIWEGDIESIEDIYLFNDHLGPQDFIYYLKNTDRYYIEETGYNRGAFIMSGLETSEKCSKYYESITNTVDILNS